MSCQVVSSQVKSNLYGLCSLFYGDRCPVYDGYRVIGTCESMGVVYCAVMTFVREEKKS